MMYRPVSSGWLLWASATCAALLMACGAHQRTEANAQHHAAVATTPAKPAPALSGTKLAVCPELAQQGVAAAGRSIEHGFSIEFGVYDEQLREKLQNLSFEEVDLRNTQEDAFRHVKATQHDDGDGIYIRFEHESDAILTELKNILQSGIDRRPAAARRVHLRQEDGKVEMQLPAGGPLITSKTDSAAKETIQKWTDRSPTRFAFELTEYGAYVTIQHEDDERIEELRENILNELFACEKD